jgi:1,4-dihydroxy-2-naphthoate octaprenyltransferase
VQVGDLTRTVYIASVPVVIATALWIWVEEMIQRLQNEKAGYQNAVMLISSRFAGRILTPILILLIYGTLFVAVFGRPALHPFSLFALISFGLGYRIFKVCWNFFDQPPELDKVRNYPIFIHLILCAAIIFSSLLT